MQYDKSYTTITKYYVNWHSNYCYYLVTPTFLLSTPSFEVEVDQLN